jgi:hypothetical protein
VITNGLRKAISTHAAAFNPMVFVKISMLNPKRKEEISNIHRGVSKGINRMK